MLALCYFALVKSKVLLFILLKVLYQKISSTMLMEHLLYLPTKGGKCNVCEMR